MYSLIDWFIDEKQVKEAFFGDTVLLQSTVTGKCGLVPHKHKLKMMQTVIQAKVDPDMKIKDIVWPQCKLALATLHKNLRKSLKGQTHSGST